MPRESDDGPRPARRARRDDEDDRPRRGRDGDDYDDRPRRRRRSEEGDATGGLIPYKNAKALTAYYCGVFALIPCVGGVLGVLALIFGFLGLRYAREHPKARGQAHAITGIVLGVVAILLYIVAPVIYLGVVAATRK
jgi:hypothetical protein